MTDNLEESPGHESNLVDTRSVLGWVAVLVAIVALSLLLMAGLLALFEGGSGNQQLTGAPPVKEEIDNFGPQLGTDQADEFAQLRQREREFLSEYGGSIGDEGFARVPIDVAMEILADNDLRLPGESALESEAGK